MSNKSTNTLKRISLHMFTAFITLALSSCTGAIADNKESPAGVSLVELSRFETDYEIREVSFIDSENQVFIVLDTGGKFIDISTGKLQSEVGVNGQLIKAYYNKGNNKLLLSSRNQLKVVDVKSKATLREINNPSKSTSQLTAFSPDGQYAYAFFKIWRVMENNPIADIPYPAGALNADISNNGQYLVTTGLYGALDLYNVQTGEKLHAWQLDANVMGARFSNDSTKIYLINGKKSIFASGKNWKDINVYDIKGKNDIAEMRHSANISTIETSPVTNDIFVGTQKGHIYRWSTPKYEKENVWESDGWVTDAVVDDQGRAWFSYERGELKVYAPGANQLDSVTFIDKGIKKLALSGDGNLIAAVTTLGSKRQLIIMKIIVD